ncbi:MAG: glycerol-3-phosphate dehydrogenase/oxidase [Deltaproteobacteria bacterium]|nr:glycerol-3-phosphate dehydrogenase/oxidase [Deltaproteobacteria bacterium]MBW2052894.1 glycerol-3-phosphate dehydrogenase/oxidase [Deltaproteobacteria bacterium]MBW2141681.1 glycerol-3-phosphate dehydrogenase/oxidase [Deltaproteobacteria bacterium]MBW2323834.1 glycerol-3-phosphate dehydrogenase/oxidase [Deltaproteobacteria bacterium]
MKKTALNLIDRRQSFAALEAETFDILIIGAGITGCGTAREAAVRGLRVALIDANDIGSGTSSRSSKLIHGGLRYLAQGDVGVVREAANERRALRHMAPHLAKKNPMVILARSKTSVTALRTAVWSYEKLGSVEKALRHEVWNAKRLHLEEPLVASENYAGAVVYPEYLTDDARLTMANARDAAGEGAVVVTYASADEMIQENGQIKGALVRDTLHGSEETARVRARVIVNSTGPWLDLVRRLEDRQAKELLQLTKGIHIVIPHDRLPITRTVTMIARDRRGIFAIPYGQIVYFGTTDTFYPKPEHWPEITREDIDYLIESMNRTFDIEPLEYKDIISIWAGIRPLLGQKGKKPSEISRRNEILEGPGGMLSVAGGKLTSYRSMAERLVDQCQVKLNQKPSPSNTSKSPLPGGDFTETLEQMQSRLVEFGLEPYEAERAIRLYGSEAKVVFAKGKGPEIEADYAVLKEGALTLEDYWVRRTSRARFDLDGGVSALEPAAKRMGELLNWSPEETTRQIEICKALREAELAVIRN